MEISENLFDSLPREITTSILQLASELSPIAVLARVCSSWQRIIYSKAFWQKCLERWQNNCCLLQPNPDLQVYLIPIRREGGERVPDYKRYYFARKNLEELSQAINGIEIDLEDDAKQEAINNWRATNLRSELTVENYEEITKWLEFAPIDSDISKMGFWFLSDFFKIFLERNDERYKSIFFPARFELRASDASRISFSSTFIDLAHFVADKHVDTTFEMVKKACLSFGKVKEANERFSKAFRDIIEQQILLSRDCTVEDDDSASFRFCMPTEVYSSDLIQAATPNAEELHQILCQVAQIQYENSNDWRIKAGALSVLVGSTSHDNELVKSTAIRLGLDAIKSPHEIVRLHGYITLHSVLVMSDNSELKDSEILLLFSALSDAIDTQPKNFGLYYMEAIGCLIDEENSDLITDEMLNKLNNSIIELLLDSYSVDQSNKTVLISLCKLGSIFGKRIASFVPRYKHALLGVLLKREIVSSAELLDIYFRLGFRSCGDEFMQEVYSLIEQAEEGKDLVVDLPLLYCLIGDIIKPLLGWKFNKNSQKILQTMIKFFDERFALYGQSCISNMRDIEARQEFAKLPETSDHSRRYFQQVIKRLQDVENLSNEDADEILEQTKNDPNDDDNEDMSSEFITAPSIFAADAVVAENGEVALRNKLTKVNHKRAIVNIMKLTVEMEQDSFPFIQQVFHIALAVLRLERQTERFIRPFIDLVKVIASLLTKQQLTYYLTLLTNNWAPYSLGRLGVDHVEALHELFAVVFSLSIENKSISANIIRNLLLLSAAIDNAILYEELEDFEHGSLLEYLSVLVTKLPNKTRIAVTRTDLPLHNDKNEHTIELAVRIMTILGFTYGVKFINLNNPILPQPTVTALRDRCLPLISKFSPDLSCTLMKPFVVLLSCCAVDDRIMDFIEMRRVFDYTIIQEAINSPQFSTGNEDLDREVKKLSNNPFALFAALKRK